MSGVRQNGRLSFDTILSQNVNNNGKTKRKNHNPQSQNHRQQYESVNQNTASHYYCSAHGPKSSVKLV